MKAIDQIELILKNNHNARNSDKELLLAYWAANGLYLNDAQEAIFKMMPSTETIRRMRQKLQERGLYPATDKVRRTRRTKEMVIEQNIPTAKPGYMDKLFDDAPYIAGWEK